MRTITFLRKVYRDTWTFDRSSNTYSSAGGGQAYWEAHIGQFEDMFESYLRVVYPNIDATFSKWEVKNNTMSIRRMGSSYGQ